MTTELPHDLRYLVLKRMPTGWMVLGPKGWNPSFLLTPLIWHPDPGPVYQRRDSAGKIARRLNDRVTTWVWQVLVSEEGVKLLQPVAAYHGRVKGTGVNSVDKAVKAADKFWHRLLKFSGEYELQQVISFLQNRYIEYVK